MQSRYALLLPSYAQRAFEDWYAYDANDEKVEAFAGRWEGLEYEHFLRALDQGEGDDRFCAMFALGASSLQDAVDVLVPFLQSTRRGERFISAIVLGKRGEASAYPALENLLLEGLSLKERGEAFARDDQEALQELFLCDRFRPLAVKLLATWNSPTLVETFLRTFQALWTWEKTSAHLFDGGRVYAALLSALGQRGAFTSLNTLDLPPVYQRIAMIYLALGALESQLAPTFLRWVMRNEERMRRFLAETFGMDSEQAQRCIETFYQENEVLRAYRAGWSEQEIEEGLTRHFIAPKGSDSLLKNSDGEEQEEEPIEQKEPVRVCVYRGHDLAVWSLAWSPDGTQVVSGSADTTAQVWMGRTGKQTSLFRGHTACVTAVAWSPDGQWIASGGCDKTVFVWNAQTGETVTAYTQHRGWICQGLAWSPDGTFLASASWDGSVHIWEAMTGKTLLRYGGHQGVVTCVAWSPNGTQVVSGGGYPECAVQVWDALTGQLRVLYKAHMQDEARVRPGGKDVWAEDEARACGPGSLRDVAWSPDGKWIASVGLRNVFRVWNAQTGEDLIAPTQNRTQGPLAWSPESTYIATAHHHGIDFWSMAPKRITIDATPVSRHAITTLSWSPQPRTLASGGAHPPIGVWEIDLS